MNKTNAVTDVKRDARSNTKILVITSLFIALTFVATWQINVRLPLMGSGGLIHLGNVPLFMAAFLYGRKTGAIAGAFGMALFDIMGGWITWAPFTFLIVGLMGYAAGMIEEKKPFSKNTFNYLLAVVATVVIKVVGYYFAEVILYGNWYAPFGSIPGNIIQVTVAGAMVIPVMVYLKRAVKTN